MIEFVECVNRYYFDDDGKVLRKEYTNLINKNFKNFIADPNEYDITEIKVVNNKIVEKTEQDKQKDEDEIYNNLTWDRKRVTKYPHIEDQIDAIYKGFMAIKETITLPEETLKWIAECEKVKKDIPKE